MLNRESEASQAIREATPLRYAGFVVPLVPFALSRKQPPEVVDEGPNHATSNKEKTKASRRKEEVAKVNIR